MNTPVKGQVDVWLEHLTVDHQTLDVLYGLLTPEEKKQCDRCPISRIRSQRIVARGRLRQLLGTYLKIDPQQIPLTVGPQGKPQVAGLEFNLSHSGNLVIYGIGPVALGIDIEQQRSLDYEALVRRFFSPAEQTAWQTVPLSDRQQVFFQIWTIKEAYLKAIGTGLQTPLSSFAITLQPPWQILHQANWQVIALDLPQGYRGAIVLQEPGYTLNFRGQAWDENTAK